MRSCSVARRASEIAMPLLTRLWWVSRTPLGEPVVPEVYWMLATSPGVAVSRGEIAAAGEHRVPGRLAEPDDVFERQRVAVARFVEDGAIVGARVVLAQEEGADARLLQHVAQFVRAVGGVDVDQDDAGAGGARIA